MGPDYQYLIRVRRAARRHDAALQRLKIGAQQLDQKSFESLWQGQYFGEYRVARVYSHAAAGRVFGANGEGPQCERGGSRADSAARVSSQYPAGARGQARGNGGDMCLFRVGPGDIHHRFELPGRWRICSESVRMA